MPVSGPACERGDVLAGRGRGMAALGVLVLVGAGGCGPDVVERNEDSGSAGAASSTGDGSAGYSESDGSSTGEPFDASRFVGRYHFENPYLPFGERGNPGGTYSLVNFEVLPDGRATMFYDDCSFDEPRIIAYEWHPSEPGWLSLQRGSGETSLRYLANADVETLRIRLIEPCRELRFEVDGDEDTWSRFYPGESCWVDRCTNGIDMQVDYCEGEVPEEACP